MRVQINPKKLDQAGVTIVELMVSVGIAAAIVTVLFAISLGFFGSTIRSQITAEMAIDSHFMIRAIIEDLRLGKNIGAVNTIGHVNTPIGSFTTSDDENILIINRPAVAASNDIIYDDETGDPYTNEYIYYVLENTLYKRQLQNTAASGNSIATTCPQSLANSACPADRKYSSYVKDMTLVFYDENNAATTNPVQARSVNIGLVMSRQVFGKTLTFNNSVLTKLRN